MLVSKSSDSKLASRLSKEMSKVIKTDSLNDRGKRTVSEGNILLLRGFDFNASAKLSTVFYAPYTAAIDRVAGTLSINVAEFVPKEMLEAPVGTTHFPIVSTAVAVNFTDGEQSFRDGGTCLRRPG